MQQVVCLSTSNFYPFPTRKQNVMRRLGNAEILYFDPPVSLIAPLKDKTMRSRLTDWKKPPQQAEENILVYALPPVIPFGNKFRFINRINQRLQARFIRKKLQQHGFDKPLLWCYSPTACDVHAHVPHSALVYDCVDRHSAYKGHLDPAVVDQMEKELATAADQVFCTAVGLYDTLVQYNPSTQLIPNGADYPLFSQAAGEREADLPPVFGFVGMLQDCIEYDYLEALAQHRPDAEIVLIGRVMPGVDVERLTAYPNVKYLGLMPQQQLPQQMRRFSCCLNLFKEGRLSRDVSPLKFYEYLATGKPIVSTREPLQVQEYADIVYVVSSKQEFLAACDAAAAENDAEKCAERMRRARLTAWDKRVAQMQEILVKQGIYTE